MENFKAQEVDTPMYTPYKTGDLGLRKITFIGGKLSFARGRSDIVIDKGYQLGYPPMCRGLFAVWIRVRAEAQGMYTYMFW